MCMCMHVYVFTCVRVHMCAHGNVRNVKSRGPLQWTVDSLVPYLLFTWLFEMGWPEALQVDVAACTTKPSDVPFAVAGALG